MNDSASRDLLRPFDRLPDPRVHNIVHPLSHILLIAIMAVLCGADDWQSVNRWAKANHKTLHEDVRFFFDDAMTQGDEQLVTLALPPVEADHGRVETRRLWASAQVAWLRQQGHHWAGLRGIVCVECQREVLGPWGKTTVERRYYLTRHDPGRGGETAGHGAWSLERGEPTALVPGCEF